MKNFFYITYEKNISFPTERKASIHTIIIVTVIIIVIITIVIIIIIIILLLAIL
jgi:hypothetical protein